MTEAPGDASMEGRVCVVTGPTSGIGKEIARGLARLGAHVVLACRNVDKGDELREELVQENARGRVEVLPLDLERMASVRGFAKEFRSRYDRLHVLVNNAGIYTRRRRLTEEGLEAQFAVNYLGPFLLTNLLIEPLRAAAPSRIVNVASNAHYGGRINFEDLQAARGYSGYRMYNDSKLALVLFTYEVARRLKGTGVTANAVHPGVIRTNLGKGEAPRAFDVIRLFLRGPRKGAETPLHVATAPELEAVTGCYFAKKRSVRSADPSYVESLASRLWVVSEGLAGLPGIAA